MDVLIHDGGLIRKSSIGDLESLREILDKAEENLREEFGYAFLSLAIKPFSEDFLFKINKEIKGGWKALTLHVPVFSYENWKTFFENVYELRFIKDRSQYVMNEGKDFFFYP